MFNFVVTACFKDIDETHQVGRNVGLGVFQRISNSGLGGQINYPIGLMLRESSRKTVTVFNIKAQVDEALVSRDSLKP